MSELIVRLFGKLSVHRGDEALDGRLACKARDLFCYLLLHRNRPHAREALASLLWGDAPTAQSKKYLRQALWQLQMALKCRVEPSDAPTLLIDSNWVQLNAASGLWLDVAVFEAAYSGANALAEGNVEAETVAGVEEAIDLYRGDLLEGCYQDWCLNERDRLQSMYLAMLDGLAGYCETRGRFDAGMRYAALSLRCDRARENTHQRLMRMLDLSGDRAAALRQYGRCVSALDEELGVKPSQATVELYEQISTGRTGSRTAPPRFGRVFASDGAQLPSVLERLRRLEGDVATIQRRLRDDIALLEDSLQRRAHGTNGKRPTVRVLAASAGRSRATKRAVDA